MDGIPDQWKKAQGLSTSNRELYKSVAADGYTILEHYLNAIPLPTVPHKNEKRR